MAAAALDVQRSASAPEMRAVVDEDASVGVCGGGGVTGSTESIDSMATLVDDDLDDDDDGLTDRVTATTDDLKKVVQPRRRWRGTIVRGDSDAETSDASSEGITFRTRKATARSRGGVGGGAGGGERGTLSWRDLAPVLSSLVLVGLLLLRPSAVVPACAIILTLYLTNSRHFLRVRVRLSKRLQEVLATRSSSYVQPPSSPVKVSSTKVQTQLPATDNMYPPLDHEYPSSPIDKMIQLLAVTYWVFILLFLMGGVPVVLAALCFFHPTIFVPPCVIYLTYVHLSPRVENKGGWGLCGVGRWFLAWDLWEHFRAYFDARLLRTAELSNDHNYLFVAHPHGFYSLGSMANFTGNPRLLARVFPGIKVHPVTLGINFRLPIWREFILQMGMINSERKALEAVLRPKRGKRPNGESVLLFPGGGEEFLHMERHSMDLVIKKRKGFARLALKTGASLVPVITFGENDVFTLHTGRAAKWLSNLTYKLARFAFPIVCGRWGTPIPRRQRLVTVVGAPIHVSHTETPTPEQIDELHGRYLVALRELYDTHKDAFHPDRIRDMEFVK